MLAGTAMAAPGWAVLIAAATSSHGPALRDEITTLAPCSAICSAMARPMPFDEPVMMATLPARSKRLMPTLLKKARQRGAHPVAGGLGGQDRGRPMREGGCQCGAVRFQIAANRLVAYACHCLECQKQSASAFGISVP